ncbi:hypothetical protein ACLOJK_022741 [Asimina triloba]
MGLNTSFLNRPSETSQNKTPLYTFSQKPGALQLHYKVFRFFNPSNKHDGDRLIYAEVFSSRTGEQKMALDIPIKDLYEQGVVFWDEALFLASYKHLAVRVEVKEEHG